MYCDEIPKLCYNFIALCGSEYYNETKFHRNMKDFMIQGGAPNLSKEEKKKDKKKAKGESIWGGYIDDMFHNDLKHNKRGILSMANFGRDTIGSQFFFTYKEQSHLDNQFSIIGEIVDGFETLDKMEHVNVKEKTHRPIDDIIIFKTTIHYNPFAE